MDADGGSGWHQVHDLDPTPPGTPQQLLRRGWSMAEATLAAAPDALTLVTHWFAVPGDDGVNADRHFGSDERTLRFLGVAVPTLIDQLGASAAILALPWDLDGRPSLTVVVLAPGTAGRSEARALVRLSAPGPPFWRLVPEPAPVPAQLAEVAAALALPAR